MFNFFRIEIGCFFFEVFEYRSFNTDCVCWFLFFVFISILCHSFILRIIIISCDPNCHQQISFERWIYYLEFGIAAKFDGNVFFLMITSFGSAFVLFHENHKSFFCCCEIFFKPHTRTCMLILLKKPFNFHKFEFGIIIMLSFIHTSIQIISYSFKYKKRFCFLFQRRSNIRLAQSSVCHLSQIRQPRATWTFYIEQIKRNSIKICKWFQFRCAFIQCLVYLIKNVLFISSLNGHLIMMFNISPFQMAK